MSDESGNEDQWLYGDSINPEPPENPNANESKDNSSDIPTQSGIQDGAMEVSEEQVASLDPVPGEETAATLHGEDGSALEEGQLEPEEGSTAAVDLLNGDDSDSDDDVNVVIGDIKPSTTYASLNIKRGGLLTSATPAGDKMKTPGKFSIEEFEAIGTINGMPAHEFNLDQLEDKPWRKPGADITDYFNYGFNEDTWRSYCERQKRIRVHESGVGLAQLGSTAGRGVIPVSITNDNSKYSTWDQGGFGPKKAGPPPGRRYAGTIDVIGGGGLASRRGLDKTPPKENVIQVMTADRRDYRGGGRNFPDMSMPPPPAGMPPPFDLPPPPHGVMPPHGMPGPPHGMPGGPPLMAPSFPPPPHMDPYGGEFYPPPEVDPYYHSYEPTQDCQWDPTWAPTSLTMPSSDVKVLTPGPVISVPPTPVPAPLASKVASKAVVPPPAEASNQDSQEATSPRTPARGEGEGDTPTMALGVVIKQEPRDDEGRKERSKDRDRSDKHKERSHRHRSRSRSTERRSRRHKSRSRSPGGHRTHRKKKSRRSEREKSKEESE